MQMRIAKWGMLIPLIRKRRTNNKVAGVIFHCYAPLTLKRREMRPGQLKRFTLREKGGLVGWLAESCANPSYAFILNLNYSLPAQQSDSEAGKGKQK